MIKDLMDLVNDCAPATASVDANKISGAEGTAHLLKKLGFKAASAKLDKRVRPLIKTAELAAARYIEITEAKIQAFLDRKAKEYNETRPKNDKTEAHPLGGSTLMETWAFYNIYEQRIQAGTLNPLFAQQNVLTQRQGPAIEYNYHNRSSSVDPAMNYQAPAQPCDILTACTEDVANVSGIGRFVWSERRVEDYGGVPPETVLRKFEEVLKKNHFDYFTIAEVNAVPDPILLGRIEDSKSRYFLAQWGEDVCLDDII